MKKELLDDLLKLNVWAIKLKKLEKERIYQPITKNKWSIAETISHLMFWDRFILEERMPLMVPKARLLSNVDVTEMNSKASEYALSEVSFEELIDSLIDYRKKIVSMLQHKTEGELSSSFKINDNELNLITYFKGTVKHDSHHIRQIDIFLQN
ncbi:DinB family protein [Chengkuizengella sediminis]|uniref:DinB family protein n=1 Tax=Chengkuizengella sediminis TaxID=1885917 RepID=UPI001389E0AC|nr:DinB family protein [Chengkuizengella sediminis]NDI34217.1 DinB family protein [Chengkuizengella sediminis]